MQSGFIPREMRLGNATFGCEFFLGQTSSQPKSCDRQLVRIKVICNPRSGLSNFLLAPFVLFVDEFVHIELICKASSRQLISAQIKEMKAIATGCEWHYFR